MISARHYSFCGGVLRSPGFSPLLNLLLAIGTVQKLLSALARILLKMDKDQWPLTSESHQEAWNSQQIPAESLLIASQLLPGVQEKVVTFGFFHHLSLSISMCEVNGGKKKSGGLVDTDVKLPGHNLRSRNKQQTVFSRFSP